MPYIKKYSDLDLTMKHTGRGDVRKKIDVDAINQHLKFLILTEQDEIPFMNNVSADVRNLLFQPFTILVQDTLERVIENIIKQYEPRINRVQVSVFQQTNDLYVQIDYVIRQSRVVGQFKTILKRIH